MRCASTTSRSSDYSSRATALGCIACHRCRPPLPSAGDLRRGFAFRPCHKLDLLVAEVGQRVNRLTPIRKIRPLMPMEQPPHLLQVWFRCVHRHRPALSVLLRDNSGQSCLMQDFIPYNWPDLTTLRQTYGVVSDTGPTAGRISSSATACCNASRACSTCCCFAHMAA